jgi:hypothetical protein
MKSIRRRVERLLAERVGQERAATLLADETDVDRQLGEFLKWATDSELEQLHDVAQRLSPTSALMSDDAEANAICEAIVSRIKAAGAAGNVSGAEIEIAA